MREVVLSSRRSPARVAAATAVLVVVVALVILDTSTNVIYLFLSGTLIAFLWRLVAPPPRLLVDDQAITVEAPAVLRHPLRIERERVHSVYVSHAPPRSFVRRPSSVNDGPIEDVLPVATSWWAPDMGVGMDAPRLLIVLDLSLPMRDSVLGRTGPLFWLGFSAYRGPTRSTVARGLFFPVADVDQALQAFAGWPVAGPLDPRLRTWVQGDRVWSGWGWRTAQVPGEDDEVGRHPRRATMHDRLVSRSHPAHRDLVWRWSGWRCVCPRPTGWWSKRHTTPR